MSTGTLKWAVVLAARLEANGHALTPDVVELLPHMDVVVWARQQRMPLTARALRERFGVSRATAFRWLQVLRAPLPEPWPADLQPLNGVKLPMFHITWQVQP
ncbi:hypothetical protein ARC78_15140 [Stenotrophomonas pictorum JCM 9942]|uniref:Uncharacterized protein n=1 Tax=Stenotrophomonas pictorum JCM 9942 TaxID=1236960 RepID=A0A0R0AD38_9GAMM|nr:hypothetical protein [Stenotrophomonas pictorum]KRG38872.1 hypothetical protein ARC78_15140 [Stenotrophomonas pictorum JCM 9942]